MRTLRVVLVLTLLGALIVGTSGVAGASSPEPPSKTVITWIQDVELGQWVQTDEFWPDDALGITASGLLPNAHFDVWIVPYDGPILMCEGAVLASLAGPGLVQTVLTDSNGEITTPVKVWDVVYDPHEYYEIVLDYADSDGFGHKGVYCDLHDGIDAICCWEWGVHINPELSSLALLTVGLLGVGGCVGWRVHRRRRAMT